MIQLRPYQQDLVSQIDAEFLRTKNTLVVLPTGGGKTVVFSHIVTRSTTPVCVVAHRQEIVTQISIALARNEVSHRIIGPQSVANICTQLHLFELGKNKIDPHSHISVAGVDTLIRLPKSTAWGNRVTLVVMDEAHHVLKKNKWGRARAMFPNAQCLGLTATPTRADGQGLGSHYDGAFDKMIVGPNMRDLIHMGALTDYRIFAPRSDVNLAQVSVTASGEFSPVDLARAVKQSHIVGDVVEQYLRIAPGKLGITFAANIEAATDTAKAYRDAGVPAEVVTSKTPDALRQSILRKLRNRELLQVVNVDLFGEGFDLPAIEVVTMARPTQSYGLYCQQFGRALRPMEGKERAIIIDHVDNVHRHGLPDARREWTLERRDKRAKSDTLSMIAVRTCPKCTSAYERVYSVCPYCAHEVVPTGRSSPEQVDGDLSELDPFALAALRGMIDAPPSYHPDPLIAASVKKVHREKGQAQEQLRAAMAQWGGVRTNAGDTLSMAQRRFYLTYGVDVATAQTLGSKEAWDLTLKLWKGM